MSAVILPSGEGDTIAVNQNRDGFEVVGHRVMQAF